MIKIAIPLRCTLLLLFPLSLAACSVTTGPYQPTTQKIRDTARAAHLTARAADLILDHPDQAERLLRDALTADLYHGPAHNNLGVIYLNRGLLYEAAHEFEWARKLMPGHPDPRMNLALTLENAGRVDEAIETYRAALEVYPGHLPSIMGLTRVQVRTGRSGAETEVNLCEIAFRASEPEWREWAEWELLKLKPAD